MFSCLVDCGSCCLLVCCGLFVMSCAGTGMLLLLYVCLGVCFGVCFDFVTCCCLLVLLMVLVAGCLL